MQATRDQWFGRKLPVTVVKRGGVAVEFAILAFNRPAAKIKYCKKVYERLLVMYHRVYGKLINLAVL